MMFKALFPALDLMHYKAEVETIKSQFALVLFSVFFF